MLIKRLAVLVSGGGTNLQAIIDAKNRGEIPHGELSLVLSSKEGAYALTRAENAGIETAVVRYKGNPDFEDELLSVLEEKQIDLIVLAGFLCILSKRVTDRYAERILNVHPSLIPSFCGAGFYGLRVHEAALEYGVKVTGATVHFVNEIPDGGRILLQQAVEIQAGDTPEMLQKRVMEQAEWKILPAAVELVSSNLLK